MEDVLLHRFVELREKLLRSQLCFGFILGADEFTHLTGDGFQFRTGTHVILVATFVVHCVAFTVLAIKRRKPYYLLLTGTFTFLSAVFLLKFFALAITVPGTEFPLQWIFRIFAVGCTLGYLIWISGIRGTWMSRLIGRR